jgi:DNA-binding Lrp family transcriptional regulator
MSKNVKRNKWSKKDDKILMKLYRNDKTYKEIGAILGRSYASVSQRVHKLRDRTPAAVIVAEKILEQPKKAPKQQQPKKEKKSNFIKSSPKPFKLNEILGESHAALKQMTRLVLYAEMLEKQNAALNKRIADIEKALRD